MIYEVYFAFFNHLATSYKEQLIMSIKCRTLRKPFPSIVRFLSKPLQTQSSDEPVRILSLIAQFVLQISASLTFSSAGTLPFSYDLSTALSFLLILLQISFSVVLSIQVHSFPMYISELLNSLSLIWWNEKIYIQEHRKRNNQTFSAPF